MTFFQYTCDATGTPLCERIHLMNLALDQLDEVFSLEVLAQTQGLTPRAFFDRVVTYMMSRDCFKTPWEAFDPTPCPRIDDGSCLCQRTSVTDEGPH